MKNIFSFKKLQEIGTNLFLNKNKANFALTGPTKKSISSITKSAKDNIYIYPIAISNDVEPSVGSELTMLMQEVYCTFLSDAFQMQPTVEISGEVDAREYLMKFHNNMYDPVFKGKVSITENTEYTLLPGKSLNDAYLKTPQGKKQYFDNYSAILEARQVRETSKYVYKRVTDIPDTTKPQIEDKKRLIKKYDVVELKDLNGDTYQALKIPVADYGTTSNTTFASKDYAKDNRLIPSYIIAKFKVQSTANIVGGETANILDEFEIPVGVKCNLEPMPYIDMEEAIANLLNNKGKIHNIIRWKTGEAVSIMDTLFGINQIKTGVAGSNRFSEWINTFKSFADLSQVTMTNIMDRAFVPIGTICISGNVVQSLKESYDIDLRDIRTAIKLLKLTYCLGLIIVDDMSESIDVLYHGHTRFEHYDYTVIKRKNKEHASDMKLMMKMIEKL